MISHCFWVKSGGTFARLLGAGHFLGKRYRPAFFLAIILILCSPGFAQMETATVSGVITDQSGGLVAGAEVQVTNSETNVTSRTISNQSGVYLVTGLKPGRYRVQIAKTGFKGVTLTDLILNVQDSVSRNFSLQVGSTSETVTVDGSGLNINTTDGSVSTVVNHNFVEKMPLNGRSFQDLILLTPGIVTNSPQGQILGGLGETGEFSVNGQRTESNYYTVDGVSANTGAMFGSLIFPSASGSLPASTTLGTTQAIVSVDALQEFRVQSSTYSAEYGRNPGGQFSFATRSGTNQWHGTAFDYLRNDFFDANNWFNDFRKQAEPPLRQNDFGGTLGGPFRIPHLYNGKDRTFFFFSYEGLRLLQPQPSVVSFVPDASLRANAPPNVQPIINAYPIANGPDLGGGEAEFIGTWSNPSNIDAYSVRLDHSLSDKLKFFFRFGGTDSDSHTRNRFGSPAFVAAANFSTRTYTAGSTGMLFGQLSNDFRLNYSTTDVAGATNISPFGGATPVDFRQLPGFSSAVDFGVNIFFASGDQSIFNLVATPPGKQRQFNLVDTISLTRGAHTLKFGVDWRRLMPEASSRPNITYFFFEPGALESGTGSLLFATNSAPNYAVYTNFSSFVEDEWRATSKLSFSLGLRWDVNPPPGGAHGVLPYIVEGAIPNTITLAPKGTPLWNTGWHNIAPRFGAAYVLHSGSGHETVVRGGVGIFYDTGQQVGGSAFLGPGFSTFNTLFSFPFPTQASQVILPITPPTLPLPVAQFVYGYPRNFQSPFTWQTNLSLQQALGKSQGLTVSYLGGFGRKLIEQNQILLNNSPNFCTAFCTLYFAQNGLTADYNALQVQFQRNFSDGFAMLASYTWSHSIDYGSSNLELPYVRGNSDIDVRHNFSAAFSYDLPGHFQNRLVRALIQHWGLDDRFTARTGFPVTVVGPQIPDPATGKLVPLGVDIVPGQPLYLNESQCLQAPPIGFGQPCPGGRAINPNAFKLPSDCTNLFTCSTATPGNAPRNFVRGFGAWQMDFAVRREFPIHEQLKLQFRAEAFNVFNHPNFGMVNPNYCSLDPTSPAYSAGCMFGQTQATLNQSLGILSSLYQMGGPRSMQFALKLIF
jgi:hypothetical protein